MARDLFTEWRSELDDYSDANRRRSSEKLLTDTEARYAQLLEVMPSAETKIEPALVVFRDKVLRLKHGLNATAIVALREELVGVETDVGALVVEMEASVAEADAFLSEWEQPS